MSGMHIFTLRQIPVFVSVWFLVVVGYFSFGQGAAGFLWAVSIFFSILVHEFGHALVARHFRLNPQIQLHGLGGECGHERAARDRDDIFIIIAGPGAGLLLGLIVYGIETIVLMTAPGWLYDRPLAQTLIRMMLYINIWWSLVNLLPFWPLDGGQLFRIAMVRWLRPARGERITHAVGTAIGGFGIFYFLSAGDVFFALIAGYFTWMNIKRINDSRASGPIRSRNALGNDLLKKAQQALKDEDYAEAARLAHQVKAQTALDPVTLEKVWEVLAVATAGQKDWDMAWSFIKKAPLTDAVFQAKVRCIVFMEMADEAQKLLASKEASRLPDTARAALERTIGSEPIASG